MLRIWILLVAVSALAIAYSARFLFLRKKEAQLKRATEKKEAAAHLADDKELFVIQVTFKGYKKTYTYGVEDLSIRKGDYVLVLTRDGIRMAEVVAEPKKVRLSQLSFPPFLLEHILCAADASDLEYYH